MAIAPIDSSHSAATPSGDAGWLGLIEMADRHHDNVLVVPPAHYDHARRLSLSMVVASWRGDPATLNPAPFKGRKVVVWPPWPDLLAFDAVRAVLAVIQPAAMKTMVVQPTDADASEKRSIAEFTNGQEAVLYAKSRIVAYKPAAPYTAPAVPSNVTQIRRTPEVTQRGLELDPLPPEFSDDALALAFTAQFGDDLRYVAKFSQWMHWSGNRWVEESTRYAWDLARAIGRNAANRAATDASLKPDTQRRVAQRCTDSRTIYAIERLANSDRKHAAVREQFDADPWVLNTPGGVVELRSGQLRPHRKDDYLCKITRATPTVGAQCPRWLEFLDRIMGGDASLVSFLQRISGYCLTGSVQEHALFFAYGTGANGKGTFLNTLQWIMGDYAVVAGMDTFTKRAHEVHKQELARLCGARLVTAQETEEGRQWAEAKIKAMTGGDPITANFMRQNDFTFTPEFKLFMAGNHKPALRSVDEAIRRRFNLIPFEVTVPAAERDSNLTDKLKHEADGILRWALDGCMEWQRIGLVPPERVTSATNEYLAAEDAVARWMGECCETAPQDQPANRAPLYRSYRTWTEAVGEYTLPLKRWLDALKGKGVVEGPVRNGYPTLRGIRGLVDPEVERHVGGRWPDD